MNNLLTTAQVAKELDVDPSRVRQLCRADKMPGAKLIGRDWMIPRSALAAARKRNKKTGYPLGRPRKISDQST